LELGSIIVLSCKKIKDLTYAYEDMNERLGLLTQENEALFVQHQEKVI
jgi:hypothetical protein